MARTIAIFDLQGTMAQNGKEKTTEMIHRFANRLHIPQIAITGALFASVMERIQAGALPPYSTYITHGGATRYDRQEDGSYRPNARFNDSVVLRAKRIGFDKIRATIAADGAISESRSEIRFSR